MTEEADCYFLVYKREHAFEQKPYIDNLFSFPRALVLIEQLG